MPAKQWAVGEDFLASDINSYLQNQSIQAFPNAAIRNGAIPVPTVGMVTFLMDNSAIEVYTDKTTPPSWRPPWNTAWGLIYHTSFGNVTLFSSAGWIIRSLPTNIPGRNYKIELEANTVQNGGAAGTTTLRFQSGSTLGVPGIWAINFGWSNRLCLGDVFIGALSNEWGIIGSNDQSAGAGMQYGRVRVYDVGPV